MTPRHAHGARPFAAGDTARRLAFAAKADETAELVSTDDDPSAKQVAIGLYVLAGIASADVICGRLAGQRWRGDGHAGAAKFLLDTARHDTRIHATDLHLHLTTLLSMKDLAHYSAEAVSAETVKKAARASRALLAAARAVSRG